MTDLTPELQYLVGETVNAVHFVMDYVELHLNGSYVRLLTPPTIVRPGVTPATFPGPGARDLLCSLIDVRIRAIRAADGGDLRIEFSDDAVVTASLAHDMPRGTEAIHFHDVRTGETQYW